MGGQFFEKEVREVAREELGTKRICPETGKKFYDLNKEPIVSPYSGKQYNRSVFEIGDSVKAKPKETVEKPEEVKKEEVEAEVVVEAEDDAPEFVSLEAVDEDGDDDADGDDEAIPDIPDVEIEVEDDDESDDAAFLDDEDEEDDDLSNVIGGVDGEEEV
jgi:uncharacterized protein (TIGR02300 family)